MGALIDHLKSLSAGGASIEAATAAAEKELAGGALLRAELEEPEAAIAGAAAETDALNQEIRGGAPALPREPERWLPPQRARPPRDGCARDARLRSPRRRLLPQ